MAPRRAILLAALALVAVALPAALGQGLAAEPEPVQRAPTMTELAQAYGHLYEPAPRPPGDLTPEAAAAYAFGEMAVHGQSAQAWVDHVRTELVLGAAPAASGATGAVGSAADAAGLAAGVLDLYRAVGLPVRPALELAVADEAAGLPAELVGPMAHLVTTVAEAYRAQAALAEDVEARWSGFTLGETFLIPTERAAMDGRAQAILRASSTFAEALEALPVSQRAAGAPLFEDPEGLVVVGSPGEDTHTQTGAIADPVLLVDPAGDDTYLNSAGGADPLGVLTDGIGGGNRLALSVVLDLDGDDRYLHQGGPATVQGAGGPGGLGLLVDVAGNDQYTAEMVRGDTGPHGPLGLSYFDGGAQGYGFAGYGLLLDGGGDDTYRFEVASTEGRSIWGFAQGFGAAGGFGAASDVSGYDRWLAYGNGIPDGDGFLGLYVQGVGFYGGVGIMTDTGPQADTYDTYMIGSTTDYYSQGFGAFAGLGIMVEEAGDDTYSAIEEATDPWINPLLNCAYGTASIGGVGIFLDVQGDDSYYGDTISPLRAATMNEGFGGIGAGYGLFIDVAGDDDHVMEAHGEEGSLVAGRGENLEGGNQAGTYLDAGGADHYVGPGEEDAIWLGGADLNLVPGEVLP